AEDPREEDFVHQRGERHEEQSDVCFSRRAALSDHVALSYPAGDTASSMGARMRVIAIVLVVGAAIAAAARAQVRDRAAPPAGAPASDAATLAAGWTALATGRHDEAARQAETILQRRRWDRAALLLKISALSAASSTRGLDSYEQW